MMAYHFAQPDLPCWAMQAAQASCRPRFKAATHPSADCMLLAIGRYLDLDPPVLFPFFLHIQRRSGLWPSNLQSESCISLRCISQRLDQDRNKRRGAKRGLHEDLLHLPTPLLPRRSLLSILESMILEAPRTSSLQHHEWHAAWLRGPTPKSSSTTSN